MSRPFHLLSLLALTAGAGLPALAAAGRDEELDPLRPLEPGEAAGGAPPPDPPEILVGPMPGPHGDTFRPLPRAVVDGAMRRGLALVLDGPVPGDTYLFRRERALSLNAEMSAFLGAPLRRPYEVEPFALDVGPHPTSSLNEPKPKPPAPRWQLRSPEAPSIKRARRKAERKARRANRGRR